MFISFTNRMSPFFPTESANDVMLSLRRVTQCERFYLFISFFGADASVCVRACLKPGANLKCSRHPSLCN